MRIHDGYESMTILARTTGPQIYHASKTGTESSPQSRTLAIPIKP
jgi:hypothetical protein